MRLCAFDDRRRLTGWRVSRNQPIADTRYCFQLEGVGGCEPPNFGDTAGNRIVTDNPAGPTLVHQLIARDDIATTTRQYDQDLHYARFDHFGRAVDDDAAQTGANQQSADAEVWLRTQVDRAVSV